ncbi:calcium-dependent phosphotriesterase [Roridomyces roridus]|uniref:Calcium-dependent phosphotriesterase n=1 Tax=Roridomyces roridus TaxID=1738132 RepID=A0AAD7AZD4_9AGAR|nr:calcium-dependent phosphotriesterase [Roridomyces roridus]
MEKAPKDLKLVPQSRPSKSMLSATVSISVCFLAYIVFSLAKDPLSSRDDAASLPPQSVLVDPASFAAMGPNAIFRNNSFDAGFNPTGTEPPFFQIFDPSFLQILGGSPSITQIASNATFAFAHEAPIYDPKMDAVTFASNDGGALGMSDINHNNRVGRINLKDLPAKLTGKPIEIPVTELNLPDTVQMTNGGTGPFRGDLLLITSGRGNLPPSIVLVDPVSLNTTVLLNNFFGRQFNSLNDIKIHPSGKIFFTDTVYGWLNHFRPLPLMPNQVYRLDPDTRAVRVVATDFDKCNGIAFTGDGKTAYVTDTGSTSGFLGNNSTEPATIYAYDVDPKSQAFNNRRIFAFADSGVPDGVQVDTNGNVYAGCGDGVQVWNSDGLLIGKFFLGTVSANMAFAGPGRLIILAETKIFLAEIAASPSLFTS